MGDNAELTALIKAQKDWMTMLKGSDSDKLQAIGLMLIHEQMLLYNIDQNLKLIRDIIANNLPES